VFCLWPGNKAIEFWMGWWDIPSAEETEIPKVPLQEHVDKYFDCQGLVHKEFVPGGKTVNPEFYKGVMNRLLKRIQRARPAAFCSRYFSCCTIMRPLTKLQVFANFWPPKNITNLYHSRTLQIYLWQTIFSFPSWKWS